MTTIRTTLLSAVLVAVAASCGPTHALQSTEAVPNRTPGGLCASCTTDTDCGEAGSASCIFEADPASGYCAPACVTDADCSPNAACLDTDRGSRVCYPKIQTCAGWGDVAPRPAGSGIASATGTGATSTSTTTGGSTSSTTSSTTTTTSGTTTSGTTASSTTSTSSSTTSSTSSTSSTSGTTGSGGSCPGYATPTESAGCTCASGHTCSANNCYGGYYCDLSTLHCVAPPASCGGTSTTSSSTTSTSTTSSSSGGTTGTSGGTGPVGANGGTVSLLHFGISGDTRPPSCEDTADYPTAIIDAIGDAEKAKGAQFALDLGDHMYVCNQSQSIADAQMNLFMQGTQHFGSTWFMTMGNHECESTPCLPGSSDANYNAFMSALAPISNLPYYSVNVHTSLGLATFVFVADNAFDTTQANWLDQVLTQADANATYTIVAKHHPEGDTSVSTNSQEMQIIRAHKFALLLTGHAHKYEHQTTDSGRDVVLGNGGAPLISTGTFNGYGMIDQLSNGSLQVTIYDVSTGSPQDQFTVAPN